MAHVIKFFPAILFALLGASFHPRVILIAVALAGSCLAQEQPAAPLRYYTDLDIALQEAAKTGKKVMLYTGTLDHLRGKSPQEVFLRGFVQPSPTVQKALADWIVCEVFILQKMYDPRGRLNKDFFKESRERFDPLNEKYDIRSYTPTITLLASDGQKIAGPFGWVSLGRLDRHLSPPPVVKAAEVAKGRDFVIFASQDLEAAPQAKGPLVACAPRLTVTHYATLAGEHEFRVKEIGVERYDDKGRFHIVRIYAAGRFTPPLPPGYEPTILLDGIFYRAASGSIALKDTTTRGVGAVLTSPGDDWISITVDKQEQLDALVKRLEMLKDQSR